MALGYKNCIKQLRKAGHKVELADRRLIKTYLNEGLTIEQTVARMLAEATLDVLETIDQIRDAGVEIETGAGKLAEIRDFRTEQLRAQMGKRSELNEKIVEIENEYQDLRQDAEIFDQILSQGIGDEVAFNELSEGEAKMHFGQLMMRATTTELPTGRPGQDPMRIWPEDRFRVAMERKTLLVHGNTPDEIYASRVALEEQMAEKRKEKQLVAAQKSEVQADIDARFGEYTTRDPNQLFQGEDLGGVGAQADVNKQRMARMLGMQLYGDMTQIQAVTVKETFQNSFDAVRTAVRRGDIEEGEIRLEISNDGRTMTITDNGVGMTAEQINKGFLTMAGTQKEGDLNSGGFGVAKMLFLAGNKELKLETVRDGVKTTLETTGEDFLENLDNPEHSLNQKYPANKALRQERTDEASGTKLTITIPDTYHDFRRGEDREIRPFRGYDLGHATNDQILDSRIVVTTKDGMSGETTRGAGKNFNSNRYRSIGTVELEWGTADILVEKEENSYVDRQNTWISIEGLNQMSIQTTENPWEQGAEHLKRRIFINLHPNAKAGEEGYPMQLNRQELQDFAVQDLFQIQSYLSVLMWRDKTAELSKGYGALRTVDEFGTLGDELDLTPPPPQQESLAGKIDTGDELKIVNGELVVDGVAQGRLNQEDMQGERPEPEEYKVDQDLVPRDKPMIHNQMTFDEERGNIGSHFIYDMHNGEVEPGQDLNEALYNEFGEDAVNQFYYKIGHSFMRIRDLLAVKGDVDYWGGLDKVGVGVSVLGDKYYGVHTKVPARMMFINPGQDPRENRDRPSATAGPQARDDLDYSDTKVIAASMMTTMVHEAAHYAVMTHDMDYIFALQNAFSTLLNEGQYVDYTREIIQGAIHDHWEIYRFIANALESGSIKNTGLSFKDVGSESRADGGRTDVPAGERQDGSQRGDPGTEGEGGDVSAEGELDDEAISAGYRSGGVVVPPGSVHPNAGEDSEFLQTVFHGSPFSFDEFDMAQIGTGEGAQAYGWGLYFAEEQDVATRYVPRDFDSEQEMLSRYKAAEQANDPLAMEMWEDAMLHWTPDEIREHYRDAYEGDAEVIAQADAVANELTELLSAAEGQLYEVDINDDEAAKMLDQDATLSEQPEFIQELVNSQMTPQEAQEYINEVERLAEDSLTESVTDGRPTPKTDKWQTAHASAKYAYAKFISDPRSTGAQFYDNLRYSAITRGGRVQRTKDQADNGQAASEYLRSVGVPGMKFLDQQSRTSGVTSGQTGFVSSLASAISDDGQTRNVILFSTDPIDQVKRNGQVVYPSPEQLQQDQARGRITFNEARKGFIEILSSGDVSTFIHETGHLYLEVLRWAAQQPNAPQKLKDDWATAKAFTGATDEQISRDAHEKWANSFEVYALEGKAPSLALQDSFGFFRSWMLRIYAKLKNVGGVHLNPEIRGVMDRLLASEEEIAVAEQSQGLVALFATAEDAGMSQEEFDFYAKQIQREHDDAVGKEHRRMMAAMHRDDMKWWKEERKKLRAEIEDEVHKERVYIALSLLQRGKRPDGSPTRGQPFKIDKKSLLRLMGGDQKSLSDLPRPFIYTTKGGVDVEVAATNLGYRNGMEMIREISNATRMKDYIESLTEVRMRQLYPDPLTDGTLPGNALRRVHTEGRAKILTKELQALRRLAREDRSAVRAAQKAERRQDREAREANRGQLPKRAELAMLKAGVREIINNMAVRNIKPHIYLRAEQKAGREAFAALEKRNYQAAYDAKLRQIRNHEMYRAAMAADKGVKATRNFLDRYTKPRKRRQLGLAKVLDQIDAVLENVDLRKRSMAEVDRDKALKSLKKAVADGRLVVTQDTQRKIMDESVHWSEFTPQELAGMKDLIKQIEHGALNEDKMTVNDELVDYKEIENEVVDQIRTENKEVKLRPGGVQTAGERNNKNVDQSIMTWLRPSSIARVLDKSGFGAVTRRIIVPIRRAYAEKLIPMLHKAQKDVSDIYNKHYTLAELGQMSKRQYEIKTLGETYSKSELISMGLNWGNQGNRDAVVGGTYEGSVVFSKQSVKEMLAHLTAKDWAFIQDIWDYNETYWEDLASAEERRRGVRPDKVEALAFTQRTADGQTIVVRGGYHPLRYDHQFDARSDRGPKKFKAEEAVDQALNHIASGTFVTANTRSGSTYNRTKNHGRVVRLGLNIIDSHLREVIRDIAIGDEVRHVKRLLDSGGVERAFLDTNNGAALEALNLWLTDAAVGELPAENAIEFGIAWVRTGFTKAKLGWNFAVMALQLTGLFQTIAVIGTRHFSIGFAKYMQNPAAAHRTAMEVSSFLHTRYVVGGFDKDVQDTKAIVESEFGSMPTRSKRAYNVVSNTLFQGIAFFQKIVDVVTWLGAYQKGLNDESLQLSEKDAVIYADSQVEAAQTSGFFSDRSGLERGTTGLRKNRQSQLLRIWTTLISYMLAKSNIAYEKTKNTNFKNPKEVTALFFDMLMLYTVEGIASALLYQRLPEDDDEPEDWALWVAAQSGESLSAGIPFFREIWASRFGGGNTPVGVFSNDAYRMIEQVLQGDVDWAAIDATADVVGTAAHLPTGQISKTGKKIWEEGLTTDDWWEYFTGPRN